MLRPVPVAHSCAIVNGGSNVKVYSSQPPERGRGRRSACLATLTERLDLTWEKPHLEVNLEVRTNALSEKSKGEINRNSDTFP